jgi:hypothetical protein
MGLSDFTKIQLSEIRTESDVEQKLILPLLLSDKPLGLAYSDRDFRTKPDIRQLTIDKGRKERLYYPDYVILYSGLPLVIIEAKSPTEDPYEGLREARLYGNELNAKFKSKLNPVFKVVCTNGKVTLCGNIDEAEPYLTLDLTDLNSVSPKLEHLVKDFSKDSIFEKGKGLLKSYRNQRRYFKPTTLLGGLTVQNREMPPNTFGANLSLDLQQLFNPETKEERSLVVTKAYVGVRRHLKHVEPIEKIIRASRPLDSDSQTTIFDTSRPTEITKKLQNPLKLRNQLLLLVGSVGSGKTTFTDYLKEVALNTQTKESTLWISINLNNAPVNREEIYNWVRHQILVEIKEIHEGIDFDDLDEIKRIFSIEIGALKKQVGKLLGEETMEYKKILAEEIVRLKGDSEIELRATLRYFCNDKGRLPVVILDNCDKRSLEDQLLAFEVASWLKETLKALIFLPIRDTTYDNHKKEKPLDTVIKDMVFRIEPPPIKDVIYQRLRLVLSKLSSGRKVLNYELPNGFRIEYTESDTSYYLVSILRSLFNKIYFNRLITGLAGRDIRKGLEIFIDFCKSGHITEDHIFKIKQSKGEHLIPTAIIARALLRGDYKYYKEQASSIKNVFYADQDDDLPNHFIRIALLRWLNINYSKKGPNKVAGYHSAEVVIKELIPFGFSEDAIIRNLNFLIKFRAIVTESQSEEDFRPGDLISLGPAGFIYLDLMRDVYYLSTIAEDSIFHDQKTAELIANRISVAQQHDWATVLENAKQLVDYLEQYRDNYLVQNPNEFLFSEGLSSLLDVSEAKEIVSKNLLELTHNTNYNIENDHVPGQRVVCEIVFRKEYGVFAEFGLRANGFIHVSEFDRHKLIMEDFDVGDLLECEVVKFNRNERRFTLKIISWK